MEQRSHRSLAAANLTGVGGRAETIVRRIWESQTANTWVSLLSRSVSLLLVLPVAFRQFSTPELAVWFVFSAIISVQSVIGFGFSPSFARLLAYARAGADVEQMTDLRSTRAITAGSGINRESIVRICTCMKHVFSGLAIVSLLLMSTLGTVSVWRPIAAVDHRPDVWLAWIVIVVVSGLSFRTLFYVTYLQGMDRLTEWRRWETVTALTSILAALMTLLLGGGLLGLVVALQGGLVANLFIFRQLSQGELGALRDPELQNRSWDHHMFRIVWGSAWKSGLTNMLSTGLAQSTGVVQAQLGSPATTAAYNVVLRVATVVGQVVQAPFLTKLPELARRRATGDLDGQLALIRRGMRLTHWSIVLSVGAVAAGMPLLLKISDHQTISFDPLLWSLFGLAISLERHGAMLNQIRNITNRPVEHIGIVGYFVINVALMFILYRALGIYAYPAAMIGTQVLFSIWFSAATAYPTINVDPLSFEKTVSVPPVLVLLILCGVLAWLS